MKKKNGVGRSYYVHYVMDLPVAYGWLGTWSGRMELYMRIACVRSR